MKIKRLLCCFAAVLCLAFVAAAPAADGVPPGKRDAAKFSEQEINAISSLDVLARMVAGYRRLNDQQRLGWTLARLSTLSPDSAELSMALAVHYASLGEKSKTYDQLLKMKGQGYGFDLAEDPRFEKVRGTEAWQYVLDSLSMNMKPFGEGKVAFELPKGDTLFESIAWDPKRQKFLIGSVRDGQIRLADKDGKLTDFIKPADGSGLWAVYALAVDAPRDLLYVSSVSSLYFQGFRQEDLNKSGIFKFKLSTGKLLGKVLFPDARAARALSSITVSKQGQVFAADGLHNEIYKIEGDAFKLVVANPHLTSLRGLAVSDDGNTLYFADYAMGVFGADLKSGSGFPLAHDATRLVLGGIEGLYSYEGRLIAIENGISPKRVIRLTLSKDGKSVESMMPLDVANPAFGMPTYGTIVGNHLYFIANSQKAAYGKYGNLLKDDDLQPVRIFRSDLRFAWDEPGISGRAQAPKNVKPAASVPDLLARPPEPAPEAAKPAAPAEKKD